MFCWLVGLVGLVVAVPVSQVATGVPIRGLPTGSSTPFVLTRQSAFEGTQWGAQTIQNCHESDLESLVATDAVTHRQAQVGDASQSASGTSKFCYFRFLSDNFALQGTPHRPALSIPQARVSRGGNINFGMNSLRSSSSCLDFGDETNPEFVDAQGFVLYPVEGHPTLTISGRFNSSSNSRPTTENQIISWKIVYSDTGDIENVNVIQEGTFTVFRKSLAEANSMILDGKVDIDPLVFNGFVAGWVGIWMSVTYEDARGGNLGSMSRLTCDQLGWTKRIGDFCGESDIPTCNLGTFDKAIYLCEAAGARLCTWSQLNTGVTKTTGCNYDSQLIWTSDTCKTPGNRTGQYVQAGDPASAVGKLARRCAERTEELAIRCCADMTQSQAESGWNKGVISICDDQVTYDFAPTEK